MSDGVASGVGSTLDGEADPCNAPAPIKNSEPTVGPDAAVIVARVVDAEVASFLVDEAATIGLASVTDEDTEVSDRCVLTDEPDPLFRGACSCLAFRLAIAF